MGKKALSESECLCPICISILIEPVTMPCNHSLCMPCYKETVEKANLTCPVCRKRISVWARKAAKTNTLVDVEKWKAIQEAFPDKVRHRLEGGDQSDSESEEDDIEAKLRRLKELSAPGEIRQEYEAALEKIRQQKEEEAKKEEEASRALIEALQQEELLELERKQSELGEIEHIDRQKALELEKIEKLHKNNELLSPAKKKSLKQKNIKKKKNIFSPSALTLNTFYASVPRKALSPLHLPDLDKVSRSPDSKRRRLSDDLPPGLADFCWSGLDENSEEPPPLTRFDHLEAGPSRVSPAKIDNGMSDDDVSSSHLTTKLKASCYQPVVRCERNFLQSMQSSTTHSYNSYIPVSDSDDETIEMSFNETVQVSDSDDEAKEMSFIDKNVNRVEFLTENDRISNVHTNTDNFPLEPTACSFVEPTNSSSVKPTENSSLKPKENGSAEPKNSATAKLSDIGSGKPTDEQNCPLTDTNSNDIMTKSRFNESYNNLTDAKEKISRGVALNPKPQQKIISKAKHKSSKSCGKVKPDASSIKQWLVSTDGNKNLLPPGSIDSVLSNSGVSVKKPEHRMAMSSASILPRFSETVNKPQQENGTLDVFVKTLKMAGGDCDMQSIKTHEDGDKSCVDSDLTQEESDRLLAMKLQGMYELMDKKNIAVDRFEGSSNEYSFRRKRRRDELLS